MNSLRRLPGNIPDQRGNARVSRFWGTFVNVPVLGFGAATVGLTGFLWAGRMESVGKEIWSEGGREGYRS